MPTLYDLSRMMGGSGSRVGSTTPSRDASVGGVSGGQSGSSSSVRYGFALADSADGWVTVQLDTGQLVGGAESVSCVCDSPISKGQRVAVDVMPNGQLKARPIGTNIIDSAVDDAAEKIQEAGKEILESVDEDMAAVNAELDGVRGDVSAAQSAAQAAQSAADDAAKKADEAASQITDVKTTVEEELGAIRVTVSGVSETADSALRQASEAKQDLEGFKSAVSQTYETKADADAAMAQEVLDRNSAITQSANSIKQEVSQNYVNNETGATLATKAELETTAQQITGRVDKVSETADSALRQSSEAVQKADEVSTALSTDYVSKTDADAKYATKSLVQQTSDSILQQVSEDYQSAESASQMQTQIDQNAEAIKTEVSARQKAVSGAVKEAKSYTDQTAEGISQTVEQEVMDEVGRTYATKTELTQTASGLELNITEAVNKADAAQNDATSAKGDASDALDKANEVSAYFTADVTGLEIGQQGKPSSVKMNSAGAFQTLNDGEVVSQFASNKIDLGLNSDASEITMMGGTFHILAVSDGTAYGSKSLYLNPVDYEGPTGYPTYDLISLQINANTWLRLMANRSGLTSDVSAELRAAGGIDIVSGNDAVKVSCLNGNVGVSGDGIWMGTTGSIVKPGGMMGGNSVLQSLPSLNATFDANSYYDCFTGDNAIGGNSAVFCRSDTITGNDHSIDDYMYIWLPKARAKNVQHTPILVSGMASAANVDNTNFAASLEISKYSGGGDLMSQGTLTMGIQTGSSLGAFCTLTCPSALVMLGRSTSGPTVYRMRMMGRSSNGGATLQSWYMTAHLM